MIRATCVGGWNPRRDRAAAAWLTVGETYPLLEVVIRHGWPTQVRIPVGEPVTPGLWPAIYFEFDSSAENWVARTDAGGLSLTPRDIADVDWFTWGEAPFDGSRATLTRYLRSD